MKLTLFLGVVATTLCVVACSDDDTGSETNSPNGGGGTGSSSTGGAAGNSGGEGGTSGSGGGAGGEAGSGGAAGTGTGGSAGEDLSKDAIWAEGLNDGVNLGIAQDYPGDQGIAANEWVYAAEDFESGAVALETEEDRLTNLVEVVSDEAYQGSYSARRSWSEGENGSVARFALPPDPSDNPAGAYFVRVCYRFDASFHPNDCGDGSCSGVGVKGMGISAGDGSVYTPCDGTNWYNAQIQYVGWGPSAKPVANDGYLWVGHLYSYNPDPENAVATVGAELKVTDPAEGDVPYRFSAYADPFEYLAFDTWRCYEVGLYLNTAGQNDGEARFWIDGVLQSRTTNIRYRDVAELIPNHMNLTPYRTTENFPHTMVRHMDNVVMSRRYIGPPSAE